MLLTGIACNRNFELPVLLFFLPWSTLLRLTPVSISCFTLALLMAGFIKLIKNGFILKNYYICIALMLAVITQLSKIISGYRLINSYIMFLAMLVLFPSFDLKNRSYNFYQLTIFFSAGIVLAALTAERFAEYSNIARYIKVDSYLNITRRCGYYGDPNFYSAQITAALAGCLLLTAGDRERVSVPVLLIMSGLLVYCGFLSGSKSFMLIAILLLLLWGIEVLVSHGKITKKVALFISCGIFVAYIGSSALFSDKIDVILTRFSMVDDVSSFTTGRTDLWKLYIMKILSTPKLLLLGQGFTPVIIQPKASHNTIIQLVYQLGIFGALLFIAWMWGLGKEILSPMHLRQAGPLRVLILSAGAFVPWLALDIMFFDELFLIPAFVFIGIKELCFEHKQINLCEKAELYGDF